MKVAPEEVGSELLVVGSIAALQSSIHSIHAQGALLTSIRVHNVQRNDDVSWFSQTGGGVKLRSAHLGFDTFCE